MIQALETPLVVTEVVHGQQVNVQLTHVRYAHADDGIGNITSKRRFGYMVDGEFVTHSPRLGDVIVINGVDYAALVAADATTGKQEGHYSPEDVKNLHEAILARAG